MSAMERTVPWNEPVDVISSDESNSSDVDMEINDGCSAIELDNSVAFEPCREISPEDALLKKAEMYQEYMKQIPIPVQRGSLIPFATWMGFGKSIKQLYGQPLHYLTNALLKQWDRSRFGTEDEHEPLDTLIHPCKAEATIWLIEEIHRRTSSHHHLAKLWQSDPMYHSCVDSIFPKF